MISVMKYPGYIILTPASLKKIMIRIILRVFLLMTFTVAAGWSNVSHAQQSTTVLTGEWVGNSEPSGRSEFLRLSLTENAGEMRRPLKAKSTLVQLEGSRAGWSSARLNSL